MIGTAMHSCEFTLSAVEVPASYGASDRGALGNAFHVGATKRGQAGRFASFSVARLGAWNSNLVQKTLYIFRLPRKTFLSKGLQGMNGHSTQSLISNWPWNYRNNYENYGYVGFVKSGSNSFPSRSDIHIFLFFLCDPPRPPRLRVKKNSIEFTNPSIFTARLLYGSGSSGLGKRNTAGGCRRRGLLGFALFVQMSSLTVVSFGRRGLKF